MKISCWIMITLILLSSCAKPPIYRAEARGENYIWRSGRQVQYYENDKFAVFFNYEHIIADKIRMYIEIANKDENNLRIDPVGHRLEWRDFADTASGITYISRAIDPEAGLLSIEKNDADETAAANGAAVAAVLFVAAAVAVAAVSNNNGSGSNSDNNSYHYCDNSSDDDESYERARRLKAEKIDFFSNKYLRRTDVFPGERVGGYLEFTFNHLAQYFTAKIQVKDSIIPFEYKVIRIEQ